MEKKLDLQGIKNIEIEILDYFVKVCEENNLIYFLDGGTLLGAVRHKGFIPWDDDIDVIMPRRDYEKLLTIMSKIENEEFKLESHDYNKDYIYPYAKMVSKKTRLIETKITYPGYGLFVDVFPLDGIPSDSKERKKFQDEIWKLTHMIDYSLDKRKKAGIKSKLKQVLCQVIGINRILNILSKKIKKYDYDLAEYAYAIVCTTNKNRIVDKRVFSDYTEVTFEGKIYKAPIGFDAYLRELYGDYMKLPPKENRISNHSFEAFIDE